MRILQSGGSIKNNGIKTRYRTIVDVLRECFGKDYKGYQRAWCDLNNLYAAWFPDLSSGATEWKNKIIGDGEWIVEENRQKTPLGADKTFKKYRIVFPKMDDGCYRFIGVYKSVNVNEPDTDYFLRKHQRVSTFINIDKLDDIPLFDKDVDRIEAAFHEEMEITKTEREIVAKARIGQSGFRDNLMKRYEGRCMMCGLSNAELLVASHIKEWSESDTWERIDTDNGLLLCSLHDSLFDKHLITFSDNGEISISNKLSIHDRILCNISERSRIILHKNSRKYMAFHREKFRVINNQAVDPL